MQRCIGKVSVLTLLVLFLLTGCGQGGASGASLADFDTRIPASLAQHVPMPEDATIRMSMAQEEELIVMFAPGMTWPESLAYFSGALSAAGWNVEVEDLPERTQGERTASWEASGHGHDLTIQLTAFGGEQGFNMTGIMMFRPHR